MVGETLTARTGGLGGIGAIAYQWRRDGTDISGATGETYTLTGADTGSAVSVRISRSAAGG